MEKPTSTGSNLRLYGNNRQDALVEATEGLRDGFSVGAQDEASMIAWLMRISYYANDELGAIALANADNPDAVKLVYDWIIKHPEFSKNARLSAQGIDEMQHAKIVVNRAKEVIAKGDIDDIENIAINTELLDKIRVFDDEKGRYIISGRLSLDDLPSNPSDLPSYVIGPTLVPVADAGSYTASLMTKGWTWLGLSNARLSREPLVINEMVKIRKQMKKSGFYDAYISSFLKNVDTTKPAKVEAATNLAKRKLAEAIEERATSQILQYVDNPLVRSQIAFSSRNFARFYRATEDAYRRLYRTVKYNPESIRKIALTYEGVAHTGFVQRDDQGEPYFIYPGVAPVYEAMNKVLGVFGLGDKFVAPMPLQFGSDIRMLTPSANPESWLPTFSGPLAGLSLKTIYSIAGLFEESNIDALSTIGQEIKSTERITLGEIGENQSFFQAILPGHVNRLITSLSRDERDSQYASAFRKAVTYLEAGGHTPSSDATPGELAQYQKRLRSTITGVLATRFVLGFISPASPTTTLKSDMAEWVRDNGRVNFKQVYTKLIEEYTTKNSPDPIGEAMADWVKLFPDEIPYVINESEPEFFCSLIVFCLSID